MKEVHVLPCHLSYQHMSYLVTCPISTVLPYAHLSYQYVSYFMACPISTFPTLSSVLSVRVLFCRLSYHHMSYLVTCPTLSPVLSVLFYLRSPLNSLQINGKKHHSEYFFPILSVSRTIYLVAKYSPVITYTLQHDIWEKHRVIYPRILNLGTVDPSGQLHAPNVLPQGSSLVVYTE